MNRLSGNIVGYNSANMITLLDVETNCGIISSLVFESASTAAYIKLGAKVNLLFKEMEVAITKNGCGELTSYLNKMSGIIADYKVGEILAEVSTNVNGEIIVSVIAKRAFEKLQLAVNDQVNIIVKSNEISIEAVK